MTSIFDRWTDLDPALALRRIEAAHGSAIFDNYAYLDPQRAIHQIESALSIDLDDVAGVLSFDSIEDVIDVAVSDSTPNWVPANAKIYIDLVNDRAWTEADGEVVISSIFTSELANAGVTFNAGAIVLGSGYESGNQQGGMFMGAAASSILDGFTAVHSFTLASIDAFDEPNLYWEIFDAPNYTTDWEIFSHRNGAPGVLDNAGGGFVPAANLPVLGLNRIAFTVAPGNRLALSLNGGAVVTTTAIVSGTPNEIWWQLSGGSGSFSEAITCYPPQLDADLPALSRIIPNNAKIHINLVQDWAWTEADGYVAIDTLLGTDANTVNGWNVSGYNPAYLTADGYVPPNTDTTPAFIGAALVRILDQATIAVRYKHLTTGTSGITPIALVSADGNDGIELDTVGLLSATASSYSGPLSVQTENTINAGVVGAINVVAFTVTSIRFDVAANGSDAVAGVLLNADRPSGNPFVAAVVDPNSIFTALQSITIYDALPSTAGLSALSETGVTNTAPTGISTIWIDLNVHGSGGSYEQHLVSNTTGNPVQLLSDLALVDPEGNPSAAWAITQDAGGKLLLQNIGGWGVWLTSDFDNTNDYVFTLRATDPGGLYVEQQFTITVTA